MRGGMAGALGGRGIPQPPTGLGGTATAGRGTPPPTPGPRPDASGNYPGLPPGAIPVGAGDPRLQPGGHDGRTGGYYRPDAGQRAADYYLEDPTWDQQFQPGYAANIEAQDRARALQDPMAKYAMQYFGVKPEQYTPALKRQLMAALDPRYAGMYERASSGGFNTQPINLTDPRLPAALKDTFLKTRAKGMWKDDLLGRLQRGEVESTGGAPGSGTLPQVLDGSKPSDFVDDYRRQRAKQYQDLGAPVPRKPPAAAPTPTPATTPPPGPGPQQTPEQKRQAERKQKQESRKADPLQKQAGQELQGKAGKTGDKVVLQGRTYRRNKNGAWVDVTDPENRERVTTKAAGKALPGGKAKKKAA